MMSGRPGSSCKARLNHHSPCRNGYTAQSHSLSVLLRGKQTPAAIPRQGEKLWDWAVCQEGRHTSQRRYILLLWWGHEPKKVVWQRRSAHLAPRTWHASGALSLDVAGLGDTSTGTAVASPKLCVWVFDPSLPWVESRKTIWELCEAGMDAGGANMCALASSCAGGKMALSAKPKAMTGAAEDISCIWPGGEDHMALLETG